MRRLGPPNSAAKIWTSSTSRGQLNDLRDALDTEDLLRQFLRQLSGCMPVDVRADDVEGLDVDHQVAIKILALDGSCQLRAVRRVDLARREWCRPVRASYVTGGLARLRRSATCLFRPGSDRSCVSGQEKLLSLASKLPIDGHQELAASGHSTLEDSPDPMRPTATQGRSATSRVQRRQEALNYMRRGRSLCRRLWALPLTSSPPVEVRP